MTMRDDEWVEVAKEFDLPVGGVRLVFPKGIAVLLIRKAGEEIYAVSNKCAHMGCPMGTKAIENYLVRCPCHDWSFDIRTGKMPEAAEIKIDVYQWKFSDGKFYINLGGKP